MENQTQPENGGVVAETISVTSVEQFENMLNELEGLLNMAVESRKVVPADDSEEARFYADACAKGIVPRAVELSAVKLGHIVVDYGQPAVEQRRIATPMVAFVQTAFEAQLKKLEAERDQQIARINSTMAVPLEIAREVEKAPRAKRGEGSAGKHYSDLIKDVAGVSDFEKAKAVFEKYMVLRDGTAVSKSLYGVDSYKDGKLTVTAFGKDGKRIGEYTGANVGSHTWKVKDVLGLLGKE